MNVSIVSFPPCFHEDSDYQPVFGVFLLIHRESTQQGSLWLASCNEAIRHFIELDQKSAFKNNAFTSFLKFIFWSVFVCFPSPGILWASSGGREGAEAAARLRGPGRRVRPLQAGHGRRRQHRWVSLCCRIHVDRDPVSARSRTPPGGVRRNEAQHVSVSSCNHDPTTDTGTENRPFEREKNNNLYWNGEQFLYFWH